MLAPISSSSSIVRRLVPESIPSELMVLFFLNGRMGLRWTYGCEVKVPSDN